MPNTGVPAAVASLPIGYVGGPTGTPVYPSVAFTQFIQAVQAAVQGISGGLPDSLLFSLSGSSGGSGGNVSFSASPWTPTVQGSATPGAQTYSSQWGTQVDIGPVRLALFSVVMSAVDGATAGTVQIGGFTAPSSPGASLCAGWLGSYDVSMLIAYTLAITMTAGAIAADVVQSATGGTPVPLPVSGLQATSSFTGGIIYPR